MENTVTIKLEDYNQMRDKLTSKSRKLDNIYDSIKQYREIEDEEEKGWIRYNPVIKIEIDKKKILEALGYDPDIGISIIY